jgi:hypothetical protein
VNELPASLCRPLYNDEDHYEFINLDGEQDAFDMSLSLGTDIYPDEGVYYGRDGEWADTALYRVGRDRWVLLFILLPGHEHETGLEGRELTPAQAARYLRLSKIHPPADLRPTPAVYDDSEERRRGQARLDRDWSASRAVDAEERRSGTSPGPTTPEPKGEGPGTSNGEIASSKNPTPPAALGGIVNTVDSAADMASPIEPVVLGGPDDDPIVYGKAKKRLSKPRYDTVKALLAVGRSLSKQELDDRSGHTDARKFLKDLAKKDEDWARAIVFPETYGSGYSIRR